MPIYEFKCNDPKCHHVFECETRITSQYLAQTVCVKCKKSMASQQISPSMFQLKGTCWARDGYQGGKAE